MRSGTKTEYVGEIYSQCYRAEFDVPISKGIKTSRKIVRVKYVLDHRLKVLLDLRSIRLHI
jgi:hypothetical protein